MLRAMSAETIRDCGLIGCVVQPIRTLDKNTFGSPSISMVARWSSLSCALLRAACVRNSKVIFRRLYSTCQPGNTVEGQQSSVHCVLPLRLLHRQLRNQRTNPTYGMLT